MADVPALGEAPGLIGEAPRSGKPAGLVGSAVRLRVDSLAAVEDDVLARLAADCVPLDVVSPVYGWLASFVEPVRFVSWDAVELVFGRVSVRPRVLSTSFITGSVLGVVLAVATVSPVCGIFAAAEALVGEFRRALTSEHEASISVPVQLCDPKLPSGPGTVGAGV